MWVKLLPALLFLDLIASILADPSNLVINGGFEWEDYIFTENIRLDVTAKGSVDLIPWMRVLHGGVQLYDGNTYHQEIFASIPVIYSMYMVHMNYAKGPGVLITSMLTTPREGAPYTVQFLMADHPDGGPLVKSLRVRNIVNNRVAAPHPAPFKVSSPYSQRTSLQWQSMAYSFVGTGEMTQLQFESLTRGPYGPIIDNVTVTLQSILENGSFENASSSVVVNNMSHLMVLSAPSAEIYGWTVTSGKIRFWESYWLDRASDYTSHMLELNAEFTTGTISSDPFATKPGKKYKVLFDTAACPGQVLPPPKGNVVVSAFSHPGGARLAFRRIMVSSEGFSQTTLGWITYELEFKAIESWSSVQFESQITDSDYGPLLDNVAVYEVLKPDRHKKLKPTFTGETVGGAAPTPLQPSLWTKGLPLALAMCVFGALVF